jgi:hypothetical protein
MVVERTGFEPVKAEPADLQSAPFGQLGNLSTVNISITNNIIHSGACQVKGFKNPFFDSLNISDFEIALQFALDPLQGVVDGLDMALQLHGNLLVGLAF